MGMVPEVLCREPMSAEGGWRDRHRARCSKDSFSGTKREPSHMRDAGTEPTPTPPRLSSECELVEEGDSGMRARDCRVNCEAAGVCHTESRSVDVATSCSSSTEISSSRDKENRTGLVAGIGRDTESDSVSPGFARGFVSVKAREEEALLQERAGEEGTGGTLGEAERGVRFLRSNATFFLPYAMAAAESHTVSICVCELQGRLRDCFEERGRKTRYGGLGNEGCVGVAVNCRGGTLHKVKAAPGATTPGTPSISVRCRRKSREHSAERSSSLDTFYESFSSQDARVESRRHVAKFCTTAHDDLSLHDPRIFGNRISNFAPRIFFFIYVAPRFVVKGPKARSTEAIRTQLPAQVP
ncbi:hypothetical protein PMIN04_013236 [Paraphaeosphaeria minitans]